jgi:adenosylmethionine-8-amino-7-oxononanoate aminotransferase
VWHPFTQHALWPADEPIVVDRAEGMYLWDTDGRRYLDGSPRCGSPSTVTGCPEIDAAIRGQLDRLDHATFLGLTHEPGIRLAELLSRPLGRAVPRVLRRRRGLAVEAALKMAFQASAQRGQQRPLYVHVAEGYHGDTLGAVSVGGIGLFHATYRPILLDTRMVSSPACCRRADPVGALP